MKRYASLAWEEQLSVCVDLLEKGDSRMIKIDSEISLQDLEAIANIRYAFMVVAELLHKFPNISMIQGQQNAKSTVADQDPAVQLLEAAGSLCRASSTSGPLHYLIKQIVRQFGFSFLRKIAKAQPWVVRGVMCTEQVGNVQTSLKYFIVVWSLFKSLRNIGKQLW